MMFQLENNTKGKVIIESMHFREGYIVGVNPLGTLDIMPECEA